MGSFSRTNPFAAHDGGVSSDSAWGGFWRGQSFFINAQARCLAGWRGCDLNLLFARGAKG